MFINRITYSAAFLKSVQPFVVKVTENSIRDNVVAGNIQRKECTLFRCSFTEVLTSNWRSLNIYRQYRSRNKKWKLAEILCAENSILYQNIILNKAINNKK